MTVKGFLRHRKGLPVHWVLLEVLRGKAFVHEYREDGGNRKQSQIRVQKNWTVSYPKKGKK